MKMKNNSVEKRFVLCVKNKGYPASLVLRKVYQVLPDDKAAAHKLIRVIDESGEDYLYPAAFFVPIELPKVAEKKFALAA
jgi:hypothetical protein